MEELPLDTAKNLVRDLYDFRDNFIAKNGSQNAKNKKAEVEKEMKNALDHLDSLQMTIDNKAMFFSLRGQVLNVGADYNSIAEDCLSKAVKLDPSLTKAWNALGECYWKNKQVDAAKNCFSCALAEGYEKETLRNLSMVLRQVGKDAKEKVDNVRESLKMAKEAIALDITDGVSWFVLGNAYLSLFFHAGQNLQILKQALAAYSRAEHDPVAAGNPDLYYNRAMAHRYEEDYERTISAYKKTTVLDPEWAEPMRELKDLENYLVTCEEMIAKKGKIKPRKLAQLVSAIKDADLGPYGDGHFITAEGQKIKLVPCQLKELALGWNKGRIVSGKVANFVSSSWSVSFSFVLVDASEQCIPVTVYNLAAGKECLLGDSVAIPEPYLQMTNIDVNDKLVKFRSIRVNNPMALVINKRRVEMDRVALGSISFINKSE